MSATRHSLLSVVLAFSVALVVPASLPAEELTPVRAFRTFDRRTARELPQSTVMALAQDAQGVLWIATLDGVVSFDGAAVRPVPNVAEAPHWGASNVLVPRRAGGVAVGGAESVSLYDGSTWRRIPTPRAVLALAETDDGALWTADRAGDVWRLPSASGSWQRESFPELGPVVALAANASGLWLAGRSSVLHVAQGARTWIGGKTPLPNVSTLIITESGEAWVGTAEGEIYVAGTEDATWTRAALADWPGRRIRCLARDRAGRIWAGGSDGYVAFGRRAGAWTVWGPANGLRPFGVMAILADREGSVWFGLNGSGLQQWVGEAWSHRKAWLPDNPQATLVQVFGITGTAQGFTAAVFSHGIWRWDGRSLQRYGRAEGITEDVRQAVEPAPGELWVAGRFGILESHAAGFRRTLTLPSGFAVGLFRAPNASWYAATSAHGLFLRRNGTWVPAEELNHDLPDLNVRSMTWRRDGELWVTTLRGVSIIRDGRGRTLPPDPRTKFPGAANVALEVGDEMWVGGFGGLGIYRDGRWRVLSAADGLPGNTIYSLQRGHDGAVWAGGSAGVGRFADGRWTVWDSRSGLIEDECNMGGLWIAPDGSVLVGTMGSLARFDARLVPIPTPPLQVFWRDRPAADADGSVRQPLGQRALRLAWSAPWLLPRAVEYRTRIARLREEWSAPRASGELSIENLGPGLWEVEVEARLEGSGDAGWTQPKAARIDIARYWWETPWAVVLAIAIVPAAVIGLVRLRTQRLHRRSVELEQVVEQRTQSLVELTQRLEESNRGLQEAVQMREDLVSIVAHDIRSPLTIIQGYAELLLSRVKNQEWRDILARIGSQSVHLAALASDILTMSRIERGALELERRPLDLLQLMRSLADERFSGRVDLTLGAGLDAGPGVDGGEALAVVLGDAGAVSEVFDNLLTNAIKYSPGGTRVEVRVSRSADAAVQVAVSDRGIGIPAEDLPLLFQKFSRLDGARQRGIPGSGLGLYICRWIVEAHGGRIEVESQPGVGSTFSVTLPLASAAPAPDQNGGRSSSRS